jgi:hypothetical protein
MDVEKKQKAEGPSLGGVSSRDADSTHLSLVSCARKSCYK